MQTTNNALEHSDLHHHFLESAFDHAPSIMLFLNDNKEIVSMNQTSSDFAVCSIEEAKFQRLGKVFGCIHEKTHNQCGTNIHCQTCSINITLTSTLSDGIPRKKVKATIAILRNQHIEHKDLLVSTVIIPGSAHAMMLLSIEDVTELKRLKQHISPTITDIHTFDTTSNSKPMLNINTIRLMMEKLYEITKIPMAILNLQGEVLCKTGWQKACEHFHRNNPEAIKNCLESDQRFNSQLKEGEIVTYKCKNGLWDACAPLYIDGKHLFNIYTGQIFLNKEDLDIPYFTEQATKFGFNVQEYLSAIQEVPVIDESIVHKRLELLAMLSHYLIKESELTRRLDRERERFHEFCDYVPDLYFILDKDLTYQFWNQACEKFFGIKKEKVLGKKWSSHSFNKNQPELEKIYRQVIKDQKATTFIHEYRLASNIFTVDSHIYPMKNGIAICIRDITEKVAALKNQENTQKQLFHTSKLASIGELAASIAHEINNPLAIILATTEILKTKYKDDVTKFLHSFEIIQNSCERIKNIVSGLRTYARQDDEKIELINMEQLIEQSLLLINVIYQKENISIEKQFQASSALIEGNYGRLQQVIINLLSNCRDAISQSKGGNIVVGTMNNDNSLIITITDDGEGISPENMEKIFESFFTTKPVGKGTGLGLSISQKIIADLSGKIDVTSKLGVGTTFKITLPTYKGNNITTNTMSQNDKNNTNLGLFKGTALIVEDEHSLRKIIRDIIEKLGLSCDEAENGVEAMNILNKKTYDYLFTDIKMPHMNGLRLIEEIKSRKIKSKIIIISGEIMEEEDRKIARLSDAIIFKPFKISDIFQTLRSFQ